MKAIARALVDGAKLMLLLVVLGVASLGSFLLFAHYFDSRPFFAIAISIVWLWLWISCFLLGLRWSRGD